MVAVVLWLAGWRWGDSHSRACLHAANGAYISYIYIRVAYRDTDSGPCAPPKHHRVASPCANTTRRDKTVHASSRREERSAVWLTISSSTQKR